MKYTIEQVIELARLIKEHPQRFQVRFYSGNPTKMNGYKATTFIQLDQPIENRGFFIYDSKTKMMHLEPERRLKWSTCTKVKMMHEALCEASWIVSSRAKRIELIRQAREHEAAIAKILGA